jgi:hypothetical protein
MNALLSNQAFDTALIALILALTAFIRQQVTQARQGAQIAAVQQVQRRQDNGPPAAPPTVVTLPSVAAHVCSACGHVDQPASVPAPGAAILQPAPSGAADLPSQQSSASPSVSPSTGGSGPPNLAAPDDGPAPLLLHPDDSAAALRRS